MHILDDWDQFYAEMDAAYERGEAPCEICGQVCILQGDNNYCVPCQARIDHEESLEATLPAIPVLEPITVRPVKLDGPTWAEYRRIVEKLS